jgi:hypothetical protein
LVLLITIDTLTYNLLRTIVTNIRGITSIAGSTIFAIVYFGTFPWTNVHWVAHLQIQRSMHTITGTGMFRGFFVFPMSIVTLAHNPLAVAICVIMPQAVKHSLAHPRIQLVMHVNTGTGVCSSFFVFL